jgi:hypothetical protein
LPADAALTKIKRRRSVWDNPPVALEMIGGTLCGDRQRFASAAFSASPSWPEPAQFMMNPAPRACRIRDGEDGAALLGSPRNA